MGKFCRECGNALNEESKICPKCGNVVIEEKFNKKTIRVKSKKTAILLVSTFFGNLGLLILFLLLKWEGAAVFVFLISFPIVIPLSIIIGLILDIIDYSNEK